MPMLRRDFLRRAAAVPLASGAGALWAASAATPRLLVVFLRGAYDAASVLVPVGSDYDGATTVRFDTSQLAQLTQALLDEGFTPDEIRAAMGGNALRVLRAGIVPLGTGATQTP